MRKHKHFSWGHKRSLFFVGIHVQEASAGKVRKDLIDPNLYVFVLPLRVDYGWLLINYAKFKNIFTFNKIYLHSRHYFTSSNCIFMQLQGIVFIQLQTNNILVNCQGIH